MIKWTLHKLFDKFGEVADYDTTYLHEITDVSAGAAMRYLGLPLLSQMSEPAPEVWAGAALASVLEGDCGPCVQLVVNGALDKGIDSARLKACLARDFENAGEVGLGFRFAEAAIQDAGELDALREEIRRKHGEKAVISASYAAATSRAYPVMKRGLGHGHVCRAVSIAGQSVPVQRAYGV